MSSSSALGVEYETSGSTPKLPELLTSETVGLCQRTVPMPLTLSISRSGFDAQAHRHNWVVDR